MARRLLAGVAVAGIILSGCSSSDGAKDAEPTAPSRVVDYSGKCVATNNIGEPIRAKSYPVGTATIRYAYYTLEQLDKGIPFTQHPTTVTPPANIILGDGGYALEVPQIGRYTGPRVDNVGVFLNRDFEGVGGAILAVDLPDPALDIYLSEGCVVKPKVERLDDNGLPVSYTSVVELPTG